jgi:hypothetical protein
MVQPDQTAKTAVVGGDAIQALPVTEVSEVLDLQAGFVGGSLRGGRSGEVAYWIDGVPVTDVFNGSQVVEVNRNLVQELQLVSGAFNAEYGQAMSGIVNIATREGGPTFSGGVGAYIGQYLTEGGAEGATGDKMVFPGLEEFDPVAIHNVEANLNGPILGDDLTFFVNGRYIYFDGWQKGFRRFTPQNISYTDDLTREFILYRDEEGRGDSALTSMNDSRRWYGQAKLTWRLSPTMKLNTNYIYDNIKSTPYNQDYRNYYYNPDGVGNDYNASHTVILQFSHTLSQNTFYNIGASWFQREVDHYLYDFDYVPDPSGNGDLVQVVVPGGPSYVHPKLFLTPDSYSFFTGGTDMNLFGRRTTTKLLKLDISSQLDKVNLVKAGVEYRRHNVFFENITLQPIASQTDIDLATANPYIQTRILPTSSNSHDVYDRLPQEFSAYIQDKLEFKNFILNIGLRYDYFEPEDTDRKSVV